MPIHQKSAATEEQATSTEMLETGIQGRRPALLYQKGGKTVCLVVPV